MNNKIFEKSKIIGFKKLSLFIFDQKETGTKDLEIIDKYCDEIVVDGDGKIYAYKKK